MTQSNMGRKEFVDLSISITDYHCGEGEQKLEAGIEAEKQTMEKYYLTTVLRDHTTQDHTPAQG